jgi:hypothetical protein
MRRLIVLILFLCISPVIFSQGIFRPVSKNLFISDRADISVDDNTRIDHRWLWRFDATVAFTELIWIKSENQFMSQTFSSVGPAVGYQHYISTETGPFNNYGVSAAVLLGQSIYNPDMAALKVALVANIFQYFKFGGTFTPNATDHWGIVLGGGITF